jgi:hypothetical protein
VIATAGWRRSKGFVSLTIRVLAFGLLRQERPECDGVVEWR